MNRACNRHHRSNIQWARPHIQLDTCSRQSLQDCAIIFRCGHSSRAWRYCYSAVYATAGPGWRQRGPEAAWAGCAQPRPRLNDQVAKAIAWTAWTPWAGLDRLDHLDWPAWPTLPRPARTAWRCPKPLFPPPGLAQAVSGQHGPWPSGQSPGR